MPVYPDCPRAKTERVVQFLSAAATLPDLKITTKAAAAAAARGSSQQEQLQQLSVKAVMDGILCMDGLFQTRQGAGGRRVFMPGTPSLINWTKGDEGDLLTII